MSGGAGYTTWQGGGYDPFFVQDLDVIDAIAQQQQQSRSTYSNNNNSPTLEAYSPAATGDGRSQQQFTYNTTTSSSHSQSSQNHHRHHHHLYPNNTHNNHQNHHLHQHHQLLLSAVQGAATQYAPVSLTATTTTTTINHLGLQLAASSSSKNNNATTTSTQPFFDTLPYGAMTAASSSNSYTLLDRLDSIDALDPLMIMSANMFATDSGMESETPPPSSRGGGRRGASNETTEDEDSDDEWLDDIQLHVSSLSLQPLSGKEILQRVQQSVQDVTCRYIPCVEFLVQCQQDLRKGLALAQQPKQRGGGGRYGKPRATMTAAQFYTTFVSPLPQQFALKTCQVMPPAALRQAVSDLATLLRDAQKVQHQGSEAVKNAFLGGMKDGESWGLRQWLSRNGNALTVCTNLECLSNAVQRLDRAAPSTSKLAAALRPLAARALGRLRQDIPASYQEVSAAHPYLPFFHRLESALRGMSNYDPAEDDVICIDDDDDDDDDDVREAVVPVTKSTPRARKRKRDNHYVDVLLPAAEPPIAAQAIVATAPVHAAAAAAAATCCDDTCSSSGDEEEEEEQIEVVALDDDDDDDNVKLAALGNDSSEWLCGTCFTFCSNTCPLCTVCGASKPSMMSAADDDDDDDDFQSTLDHLAFDDTTVFDALDGASSTTGTASSFTTGTASSCTTAVTTKTKHRPTTLQAWPARINEASAICAAAAMADNLDKLAVVFENDQEDLVLPESETTRGSFWDGDRYAAALRVFCSMLQRPDCCHFIERPNEDILIHGMPYSHVIKNPLCFRDIVVALIQDEEEHVADKIPLSNSGKLPRGPAGWNMWRGVDLLQALDLVLLNSLAFGKAIQDGKSGHRSATNKLRKVLWNGIGEIVNQNVGTDPEKRRQCTPIRRSETSGFVVYKIKER